MAARIPVTALLGIEFHAAQIHQLTRLGGIHEVILGRLHDERGLQRGLLARGFELCDLLSKRRAFLVECREGLRVLGGLM